MKDGNTYTTSLRADFPSVIKDYIESVSARLNQFGVCNFQLRMDQGVPKIFEINARHSGTTYIRSLYGFNEVEYILELILNKKEIDLHTNSIQVALNNTSNGEIVSWHNGERLSSGKVRVVSTYYKNEKYCRIFQSYIKLNGAEKHTTKHVCRIKNIWQF